jgi:competence protein ComEC
MTRSVLLSVFACVGLSAGMLCAYFGYEYLLLLLIPFAVIKFKQHAILYLGMLLLCYNIGNLRADRFHEDMALLESLRGQEIVVSGIILEDLTYHESGQREFHIGSIVMREPQKQNVSGRLRVRSYQTRNLYRGDSVTVSGKVYRALGNRHGSIQYAQIANNNKPATVLEQLRLQFFASTHSVIPDPQSSLGLGFLVGVGNMLPDELDENLRTVGLTHIVAVSGYNLTILVLLARRALSGVSKNVSTFASIFLLVIFLLLTGGAPSIVRASIVSALGLAAWYYGRKINPLVLLLVSATISGLLNPYYLWKDIGWYLSFTAFFGVLVLAPLITQRIFNNQPKLFGQLLIETTCAQILTFPIIAFIFGDISVIALVANLMVLPLVPLSMATTFLAGATNMILPNLSGLAAFPARWLLGYIVEVTNLLSRFPGALVELNITLLQLAMCYGLIGIICLILYRVNTRMGSKFHQDEIY